MRNPRRIALSLVAIALAVGAAGVLGESPRTTVAVSLAGDALGRPTPATRPGRLEPGSAREPTAAASARPAARTRSAIAGAPATGRPSRPFEDAGAAEGQPRRSPSGAGGLWLVRTERPFGGPAVRAVGFDLAAPRALTLWRVDPTSGRAAALAHVRSQPGGGFAFDGLLVSDVGARLVVTERGGDPRGVAAARVLDVAPREPPPPPDRVEAARQRSPTRFVGGLVGAFVDAFPGVD